MEKAKNIGIDSYQNELDEKIALLEVLLKTCDDGRRKSFFCLAVNLLEVQDVRLVMEQIASKAQPEQTLKEKAAMAVQLFQCRAAQKNITLKLRKK